MITRGKDVAAALMVGNTPEDHWCTALIEYLQTLTSAGRSEIYGWPAVDFQGRTVTGRRVRTYWTEAAQWNFEVAKY
jgi:hypothetical protein